MKTRKNTFSSSGSRDYLDFVSDFIQIAIGAKEKDGRERRFEYKNSKIPRYGLCGATENLVKTECCDTWICDDEDKYVMFSYERNSCHRNHDRYTLCSYHHKEKHPGHWKTCEKCKKEQKSDIEMFAHMGTDEYNFEYLDEIPSSESKRCQKCSG